MIPKATSAPRDAWRTAFTWWAATRPTLLILGYVAILVIGYGAPDPVTTQRVYADDLANLPARWDTFFYLEIASHGYHWDGSNEIGQTVAFFPGFPLVMRAVSSVSRLPVLWAGVLVSLAAFLLALVYLYRLASDLLDPATARASVALLATYPAAVFFSAPYSEALFLLACVAAFYHFRRRELVAASAFGLLAGLTRVPGFLLCVPLAWMAWRDRREPAASTPRARALTLLALAAPVLGVALYSGYMYTLTGRPLVWIENQAGWGTPYYADLLHGAVVPYGPSKPRSFSSVVLDDENYVAVAFAAATLPFVVYWLGVEYGLFVLACLLPGLLGHGFTSLARFTSVVFPLFIALARGLRTPRRVYLVAGIFFVGQIWAAAMFFTWRHFF